MKKTLMSIAILALLSLGSTFVSAQDGGGMVPDRDEYRDEFTVAEGGDGAYVPDPRTPDRDPVKVAQDGGGVVPDRDQDRRDDFTVAEGGDGAYVPDPNKDQPFPA